VRRSRLVRAADSRWHMFMGRLRAACTSTVPTTSCSRVPLLLSSTSTFAPMPRPPVYHAQPWIPLTSSTSIPSASELPSTGFRTLRVYTRRALRVPDSRPYRKSIRFRYLRTLFLSCRSFPHSFPLFSMVCGLFCKIPGGGGIQTVLEHPGGLLRWLFTGKLDWRWFKTGEPTSPRCRPRRLHQALQAPHRAAAPARGLLQHPA
jgi:hypothetical protein